VDLSAKRDSFREDERTRVHASTESLKGELKNTPQEIGISIPSRRLKPKKLR